MSQPPNYEPAPGALSPQEERNWAMVAHGAPLVAMLISGGFLGFVGSLIVYLIYRDRGPFVRAHSANSLNIQITAFIVFLISIPLFFACGLGILTAIAAAIYGVVFNIIGLIKASSGQWWDPPWTPKFVS